VARSRRADGTVVHQVLRCQSKAQMIDNAFVQQVKTIAITADELWSFIQNNKTLSAWGTEVIAGLALVRPQVDYGSAVAKHADELQSVGNQYGRENRLSALGYT